MTKITSFAGVTTTEILAAVNADKRLHVLALGELAGRVMRTPPRAPAVEGFLALVHGDDAPARPVGDPTAYKAWVADAQADAAKMGAKASPRAKAKPKAPAKKAPAKRASKPKASGNSAIAAKLAGMTAAEKKALAKFFASF